jgi:hypothetical protein
MIRSLIVCNKAVLRPSCHGNNLCKLYGGSTLDSPFYFAIYSILFTNVKLYTKIVDTLALSTARKIMSRQSGTARAHTKFLKSLQEDINRKRDSGKKRQSDSDDKPEEKKSAST